MTVSALHPQPFEAARRDRTRQCASAVVSAREGVVRCIPATVAGMLTLGTDFSGMDVPAMALRKLGVKHVHMFASDTNPACRKVIKHVFRPRKVYTNIQHRTNATTSKCQLYVFGHPCQPFSSLGNNIGESDDRCVLGKAMGYIRQQLPQAVLMENVAGLASQTHRKTLLKIIRAMRNCDYKVYWKILNTYHHGVPHSRRRLYLVGMTTETHPFSWPDPIPVLKNPGWLTAFDPTTDKRGRMPDNLNKAHLVKLAYKKCEDHSINPCATPVFVDVGCTPKFAVSMARKLPCLSATRGASFNIWVSTRGRCIQLPELFRLQGIDPADYPWEAAGVTASQMGRMLGNAMSLNMCERVLASLIWSAGLVKDKPSDRWALGKVAF